MERSFYINAAETTAGEEVRIRTFLSGENRGAKELFIDGRPALTVKSRCSGISEGSGETVYFDETVAEKERLVIFGGGHVSQDVIRIAKILGFYVEVCEDREEFAALAEKAGADEVHFGNCYEELFPLLRTAGRTCYLVLTRGHSSDAVCLYYALGRPARYVGMIGSRRKNAIVFEKILRRAEEDGRAENPVFKNPSEKVHAPVGLPIGAQTPAEIAVSIMAEIIEDKYKNPVSAELGKEALEEIIRLSGNGPVVHAVITFKEGSAPRGAGARMIVGKEGLLYGTVGGGPAEAAMIRKAQKMLEDGTVFAEESCDMNGEPVSDKPVCGGRIRVMLEMISS